MYFHDLQLIQLDIQMLSTTGIDTHGLCKYNGSMYLIGFTVSWLLLLRSRNGKPSTKLLLNMKLLVIYVLPYLKESHELFS